MKYLNGLITAALLVIPAAASAHQGDHSFVTTFSGALTHLVTHPDHALGVAACAAIYF